MAQTTAQVLSSIFKKFATDPVGQHRAWAKALWEESAMGTEVMPGELNCDAALITLHLASRGSAGMIYGPVLFVPEETPEGTLEVRPEGTPEPEPESVPEAAAEE